MKMKAGLIAIAVTATIGLGSCSPKDADIEAAVTAKLQTEQHMNSVTVDVEKGVATIAGECKDETCKAECEKMAKEVKGVKSVVNNLTVPPPPPPPVQVTPDDPLTQSVKDATKDFAGVQASVNEGVITLTGDIKRSDLPRLMKSLNSLKPKKIENQLTIN